MLVLGILTLLAPAPQEAAPAPASIVLVTADTLRREHLGCYGYPRATSPTIDALAREAVLFERAYAPMSTTFPSHLTMLTGLYPHQHGHTSNRGAVREPYQPAPGRMTLASALAQNGYHTGAFVSSSVLNERTGIGAGFQTYSSPPPSRPQRPSGEALELALEWLAGLPPGEPFFLWLHLWDTHDPNEPGPAALAQLAPDETLRTWLRGRGLDPSALHAKFNANLSVGQRFFQLREQSAGGGRANRPLKLAPGAQLFTLDEEALLTLYSRYDACVRQVDDQVARLLAALRARGVWDETAFVFCADHGQALGDNATFGHGTDLQINVAVPLLLRFPTRCAVPAQRNARNVSLLDLAPTLLAPLAIGGLETYRAQLRGLDALASDFARAHVVTAEETEAKRGKRQPFQPALLGERWKYVRGTDGGRLYDLAGQGELADVAAQHPALVQELEALLAAELASARLDAGGEGPLDPEREALLKGLKELGYGGDDEDE